MFIEPSIAEAISQLREQSTCEDKNASSFLILHAHLFLSPLLLPCFCHSLSSTNWGSKRISKLLLSEKSKPTSKRNDHEIDSNFSLSALINLSFSRIGFFKVRMFFTQIDSFKNLYPVLIRTCIYPRAEEEKNKMWPPWLKPLLREKFFVQCKLHADSHKSECNMYCLDCTSGPLCSLCLSFHKDHQAIQIRRSSYHDVIRVSEIQKFLDITGVQTYVINSAKVVFLNERPQPRQGKGVVNTCEVCYRSLVDSFRFCSLGCKISGISKSFDKKRKDWTNSLSDSNDSYSSSTSIGRLKKNDDMIHNSFTPSTPPLSAVYRRIAKRRKGIPHRAPFGGLIIEY
ncbi:unnamed protein product [Brassica oleracea]|uniref:PLATZ transcription factor family protein n=1 Tax=Brassica oleracea var. oleracea TaxID=109376 RepID=A0A0D3CDS7_BRAOL